LEAVPLLRGAGNRALSNRNFCPPVLGVSKFVVQLKTVRTFTHKTNGANASKTDHNFVFQLLNQIVRVLLMGVKFFSPKITLSALKMLIFEKMQKSMRN